MKMVRNQHKCSKWGTIGTFLTVVLLTALPSCASSPVTKSAVRTAVPATRAASVVRLQVKTYDLLRSTVRERFGEGPFVSGQVLAESEAAKVDFTDEVPDTLLKQLQNANLPGPESPVIALQTRTGLVRLLQLGRRAELERSLVVGRERGKDSHPNDRVYRVENRWIRELIEWDTCDRAIAGDTSTPTECGIDDCPVMVSFQRFIHPSGKEETLQIRAPSGHSPEVLQKHDRDHKGTFMIDCKEGPEEGQKP